MFGKVQRVWFREFVRKTADNLEIYGWVKNNSDESVSAEAEGTLEHLNQLINKIKIGSPLSKVKNVQVDWIQYENKYKSFKILS